MTGLFPTNTVLSFSMGLPPSEVILGADQLCVHHGGACSPPDGVVAEGDEAQARPDSPDGDRHPPAPHPVEPGLRAVVLLEELDGLLRLRWQAGEGGPVIPEGLLHLLDPLLHVR